MFKKLTFILLLCQYLCCLPAQAQRNTDSPDIFSQYFNNFLLLNPASQDTLRKISIFIGNRTETGLLKGISNSFFDLNVGFAQPNARQQAGIQFFNNREGEYISRNRVYGRYSWATRLGEGSMLAAGISMGLVNFTLRSSMAGAGGAATVPDGNIGIWWRYQSFAAGISMQQIFNNTIQPINQKFTLYRYFNANIVKHIPLSSDFYLQGNIYYKFTDRYQNSISVAAVGLLQEKFQGAISYRHQGDLIFTAGIKSIKFLSSYLSFTFSYLAGINKTTSIGENSLEGMFGAGF